MSDGLKNAFLAFANYGTREFTAELDNRSLVKLFKDSGIVDAKFTTTDVDLIFAKVKSTPTARKLKFEEFCRALDLAAEKKKVPRADLEAKIEAAQPKTQATVADAVKFHDDKSLYTGVYANGGPTNVDKMAAGGLGGLLDRTPADVRGVKKY